jgi:hypothetical protein
MQVEISTRIGVFQMTCSRIGVVSACLATAAHAALGADNGVLSTYIIPHGDPPAISVDQIAGVNGQLRYSRLREDVIEIPVDVYGRCNVNFRIDRAYVGGTYEALDGRSRFVGLGLVIEDSYSGFHQEFEVNTNNQTFGPRTEILELDREELQSWLVEEGEALVDQLAETSSFTEEELRSTRIDTILNFHPTFYFSCRRWAFGNGKRWQSSYGTVPLTVHFEPDTTSPVFDELLGPPEGPTPIPVPVEVFTAGVRIDQNSFHLVENPEVAPCGFVLGGAFVTSGPTTVRYRIEDHLGALSPEFSVDTGRTRTAFVSHDVAFSEETGNALGFTAPQGEGDGIDDTLESTPTDNLQGYFRVVTTAPHGSRSNIVSYNIDTCESEALPVAPVFDAVIMTDPEVLPALVQRHERRILDRAKPSASTVKE